MDGIDSGTSFETGSVQKNPPSCSLVMSVCSNGGFGDKFDKQAIWVNSGDMGFFKPTRKRLTDKGLPIYDGKALLSLASKRVLFPKLLLGYGCQSGRLETASSMLTLLVVPLSPYCHAAGIGIC